MNKLNKNIAGEILEECGFSVETNKDIEKLIGSSINREPKFELDEKIKNYAYARKNKNKNHTLSLFFKWSIPLAAAALFLFIFIVDFNSKTAGKSNLKNQYYLTDNEIFNLDVELVALDVEIELVENELQESDDFLTNPSLKIQHNIDSSNKIKDTSVIYEKFKNTV
jgi:hypothetical protein